MVESLWRDRPAYCKEYRFARIAGLRLIDFQVFEVWIFGTEVEITSYPWSDSPVICRDAIDGPKELDHD